MQLVKKLALDGLSPVAVTFLVLVLLAPLMAEADAPKDEVKAQTAVAERPPALGSEEPQAKIYKISPGNPGPGDMLTMELEFNSAAKEFLKAPSDWLVTSVSFDGEKYQDSEVLYATENKEIIRIRVPDWLPQGSSPAVEVEILNRNSGQLLAVKPVVLELPGANEGAELQFASWFNYMFWAAGLVIILSLAGLAWLFVKDARQKRAYQRRLDRLNFEQERLAKMGLTPESQASDEKQNEQTVERELEVPDLDPALVDVCAAEECVLFAGSGVGIAAGYPSRSQKLYRMLDELEAKSPNREWEQLKYLVHKGDFSVVEDLLQSRLPNSELIDTALRASMHTLEQDGEGLVDLPEVLTTLSDIKFRGAIASGWNELLERAFKKRTRDIFHSKLLRNFASFLRTEQFFILKPYGDRNQPESLLFTPDQYAKTISEYHDFAQFVGSIVASNSLFFVGASLATIEEFLENSEIRGNSNRVHFALVPREPGIALQQERLKDKFNLKLIVFKPSVGYPEVIRFAEKLRDTVVEQTDSIEKTPQRPEILNSVVLRNIGPFESFELDLQPGWNILLGDNGCGKSTIMRAIGLALCGSDGTQDAAANLLRSGTSKGSIELRIGKDVYRADLMRAGHRVKVSTGHISPVQGGRWLVLGFPALRGGSLQRIQGPKSQELPNPVVDDLLPLVNEEIDLRFDNLKQWLINTAVLAEGKGRKADLNRKLLKSFFRDMKKLSPGVDFKYKGYSSDPWDIVLETEDGEVSIGYLSQGMSSVFSWVGTLLQRLYAVYPDSDEPEREQCLVLVDEIDAHLHPEWQSEIVSHLRAVFPNLQVIATTHSPLLVADAEAGAVVFIERDNGKLRHERINHSFKGWRADQILTAEPFGMSAARGKDTKDKLAKYRTLAIKDELDAEEQETLDKISRELESDDLPSYQELQETREAAEMVKVWMRERIEEVPEEKKRKMMREAQIYLAKIKAGK